MTIKELRSITGLTQTEFGLLMGGISMRTIQNWELGYRNPTPYLNHLIEFKVSILYPKEMEEEKNKKAKE